MAQKLLFVCLGNICRSPAAECIANYLIAEQGLTEIECDSAGTASYHIGNPPDKRMRAAGAKRGITIDGRARQFTKADLTAFDRILAMDGENYRHILSLDPEGKYRDRVRLMCDYATRHDDRDVPDPYYGGEAGFDYTIDLLLDACGGLLAEISEGERFANAAAD